MEVMTHTTFTATHVISSWPPATASRTLVVAKDPEKRKPVAAYPEWLQSADSVEKVDRLPGVRQHQVIGQREDSQHDGTIVERTRETVLLVQHWRSHPSQSPPAQHWSMPPKQSAPLSFDPGKPTVLNAQCKSAAARTLRLEKSSAASMKRRAMLRCASQRHLNTCALATNARRSRCCSLTSNESWNWIDCDYAALMGSEVRASVDFSQPEIPTFSTESARSRPSTQSAFDLSQTSEFPGFHWASMAPIVSASW